MAPTCCVCGENESKYKCPTCELRYCSLSCYKQHKTSHEIEDISAQLVEPQPPKDRPGTKQRVPKVDLTGFENDPEFKRLLLRYPLLKVQLQSIYALTLDPGPDDARRWDREALPGFAPAFRQSARGRGRGFNTARGRGSGRGDRKCQPQEDRQHGKWTQAKGAREALDVIQRFRTDDGAIGKEENASEGMNEFVHLCQIRFSTASE